MSQNFVTVTGASGHIGHRAAEILLSKSVAVRAVARHADRLASLKGAEIVTGDMSNPDDAARALTGASAAFLMIPPEVTASNVRARQNQFADSYIQAIQKSDITHVVVLSSLGAERGSRMGPVNGIHDFEQKLKALADVNILILRPGYFMENLLANVGMIKSHGMMGSPVRPDAKIPMVATRDIAAAVAGALAHPTFTGHSVRELQGQRHVSMEDARAAIAKALDLPSLKYVQFPDADAEKAMTGMGLSADYARLIVEMCQSLNDGTMKPTQARGPETTTPTSIETFAAEVVAPAVKTPLAAGR